MGAEVICSRRVEFDSGHRVYKHEGKCAMLHGHRYAVELVARVGNLDAIGRVVDFGVLKEAVGGWVDDNWDHGVLLHFDDPLIPVLQGFGQKVYVMPYNPTAERIAEYLLHHVCPMVLEGEQCQVFKVRVWETPNCWAEVTL